MIEIKVPATSANLGPGFDTFGMALNIFNTFYVDNSDDLNIENVDDKFKNRENLFVVAYDKTLEYKGIFEKKGLYLKFENIQIPISRGLGSSSSLVVGGVIAANNLHNLNLSEKELLQICNSIEGHPDNVAPCLLGSFVTSVVNEFEISHYKKIKVHDKFFFTVMIPDFKVETLEARKVMPRYIEIKDAIYSMSRAISLCFALQEGDERALNCSFEDKIHEPYRKNLIPDFENLKKEALEKGALAFIISGSGSTCLAISTDKNFSTKINLENLKANWELLDCSVCEEGATVKNI